MQQPGSKDYFQRRAEQERTAAEQAGDERAAQSHRELAERYDEMAKQEPGEIRGDDQPQSGIMPKDFRIVP